MSWGVLCGCGSEIFFVHEMNEGCLREAGSWHCVWLRVVLQTPYGHNPLLVYARIGAGRLGGARAIARSDACDDYGFSRRP